MLSLLLRNLFFTILQPGIVAGLIPYWILRKEVDRVFIWPWRFYNYLGLILFIPGIALMLNCIIRFAVQGRGTLSPLDPTKRLVIAGPYRFCRNPMYVGVMMILIGETIFSQSVNLLIYSIAILIGFNLFIIFFEEPRLKREFGEEYRQYCQKVRRWI